MSRVETPTRSDPTSPVVDCIDTDVHEDPVRTADLAPYTDPVWRRDLLDEGYAWVGRLGLTEVLPYAGPFSPGRAGWMPPEGRAESYDRVASQRHLLEEEHVTHGNPRGAALPAQGRTRTDRSQPHARGRNQASTLCLPGMPSRGLSDCVA